MPTIYARATAPSSTIARSRGNGHVAKERKTPSYGCCGHDDVQPALVILSAGNVGASKETLDIALWDGIATLLENLPPCLQKPSVSSMVPPCANTSTSVITERVKVSATTFTLFIGCSCG